MSAAKTLLMAFAITAGFAGQAQMALRFNVVMTEIMADPSPVVGLPNAEYIEIRNVSSTSFNLNGWQLSDETSTATITTTFLLQPDSAVILCANSNTALFSAYGRTIGVTSFPSLDNDGELLTLRSPQNRIIHALNYTADWYDNDIKKEGGWSLEMMDPKNPCTGKENWKASTSNAGGTPGKQNSVNGANADTSPPQIKKAYTTDSVTLVIVFNEPLDSTTAAVTSNYSVTGAMVAACHPVAPLFQSVQLKLNAPMQVGAVYNVTVSNVADCKGNTIGAFNRAKLGRPQAAEPGDVVINEILFNPVPGGYDYVEFFNRSNKIIDAASLYIANRSGGNVSSIKRLTEEPFYLFPGDYAVVTENKASLQREYLVKTVEAVLELSSLPSFPDDKGTVVLLHLSGNVMDEVAYDEKWHFALIDNREGVALERIDATTASQHRDTWHSAASTAGYGTPTYLNSQYRKTDEVKATVELSPAVFSPDNDGRDDVAAIQYKVEESGYVANVSIFDASGRLVRYLVKNELLSLKGFWKWDGLGEKQNKLSIGTYIVYTEIFNLQGKKKSFKNTVVLARRLN